MIKTITDLTIRFQSTHPVRGATLDALPRLSPIADFNPRTP